MLKHSAQDATSFRKTARTRRRREAAGGVHGVHGDTLRSAHSGCVLFLDFVLYANGTRVMKIKLKSYIINFFASFSESPKMPKNGQKRANLTEL
jgi:hypothetical protein